MQKRVATYLLFVSSLVASCQSKPEQHNNYSKIDTEKYNQMTPQDLGMMAKHLSEELGNAPKADSVVVKTPQPK